jgi:hypothetical protein
MRMIVTIQRRLKRPRAPPLMRITPSPWTHHRFTIQSTEGTDQIPTDKLLERN